MNKKNKHKDNWRAAWDAVNKFRATLDLAPHPYEDANDPDTARLFCNVLNHIQPRAK